jgi:hypothetical protein
MTAPAKTAKKQGGAPPFKPGQSGNPAGRPKGSRNKATLALDALLDGEGEAITRKAIELATSGDTVALRLCLDRILPVRKDRPVTFALPPIDTTADLVKATSSLLQAVAAGDLTPSEAAELGKLVDAHVRAIEVTDIQERLARIEAERQ